MSLKSDTSRAQKLASEALGTTLLLAAVVGSGIMGERLAGGNVAIAFSKARASVSPPAAGA